MDTQRGTKLRTQRGMCGKKRVFIVGEDLDESLMAGNGESSDIKVE